MPETPDINELAALLTESSSPMHLGGRTLSAWCAWDTLPLPKLIGAGARVTSQGP